jgi:hypothetical protein
LLTLIPSQWLSDYLSAHINLDRPASSAPNAPSTVSKVSEDVARYLGYLINVEGRPGVASMEWLLDGEAIMRFVAWAQHIRCAGVAWRVLLAALRSRVRRVAAFATLPASTGSFARCSPLCAPTLPSSWAPTRPTPSDCR